MMNDDLYSLDGLLNSLKTEERDKAKAALDRIISALDHFILCPDCGSHLGTGAIVKWREKP